MLTKAQALANIASVREQQLQLIASVDAKIGAIGTPHDIRVRMDLERMKRDANALRVGLAEMDAHYARVAALP